MHVLSLYMNLLEISYGHKAYLDLAFTRFSRRDTKGLTDNCGLSIYLCTLLLQDFKVLPEEVIKNWSPCLICVYSAILQAIAVAQSISLIYSAQLFVSSLITFESLG